MLNFTLSPEYYPQSNMVVNRVFFVIAGSHIAGSLLNQLCFWQGKGRNKDGWIYKSFWDWNQELFWTRDECERARKELIGLGLLEEKRFGLNPTKHYRVNMERLKELTDKALELYREGIKPYKAQQIEKIAKPQKIGAGWEKAFKDFAPEKTFCEPEPESPPQNSAHTPLSALGCCTSTALGCCTSANCATTPGDTEPLHQQGLDDQPSGSISTINTSIKTNNKTNNKGTPLEPAGSLQSLPQSGLTTPSPHQDFSFCDEKKEETIAAEVSEGLKAGSYQDSEGTIANQPSPSNQLDQPSPSGQADQDKTDASLKTEIASEINADNQQKAIANVPTESDHPPQGNLFKITKSDEYWLKSKAGKLILELMAEMEIDPKTWKKFAKYWGDQHNVANWGNNKDDFNQLTSTERGTRIKSALKRWASNEDNLDDLIGDLEGFKGRLSLAKHQKEDAKQSTVKTEEIKVATQEEKTFIVTRGTLWREARAEAEKVKVEFSKTQEDFSQQTLEFLGWTEIPAGVLACDAA